MKNQKFFRQWQKICKRLLKTIIGVSSHLEFEIIFTNQFELRGLSGQGVELTGKIN